MALSSPGIGSNLDVNNIVTQLMTVERQPLQKLNQKEAVYQTKLTAYGAIKGALSAFQDALGSLKSAASFQTVTASVADASVASASASNLADVATYALAVTKLAQSHKLASAGFAGADSSVGSGTLTLQFGTDNGGGSFTANAAKATQTIVIGAGENTLGAIRDKINAAHAGVTATIINDGLTGYKLVLTSNDSGAANSLKITAADDDGDNTDPSGLSQLVYNPSTGGTKNLSQVMTAQNAEFSVDGIAVSKASNSVSDVIHGVTLNLLKAPGATAPTTITVARNSGSTKSAIDGFVKAYNELNKDLHDLSAYDPKTKTGGALLGDRAVLAIQSSVRSVLSSSLPGSAFATLSQIGISFQRDGSLAVNAAKLQSAISSDADAVAAVFSLFGKASDSQIAYAGATAATRPGSYAVTITQAASQAVYAGSGVLPAGFASPVTIDASNDTLSLSVDGVGTGSITLSHGSYASGNALAAEIQSKINGAGALQSTGASAIVQYDSAGNRLKVLSSRYGATSAVQITAVGSTTAATLGLAVGLGTPGTDLAGTLDGYAATGSGQTLTAAGGGPAEGLQLLVSGGGTGARGTVSYSKGYAVRLDETLSDLLSGKGPISSHTDGINTSLKNITSRREVLNRRLADVEARYRAQYTRLDAAISSMSKTSNFLTQQLAVWQNTN